MNLSCYFHSKLPGFYATRAVSLARGGEKFNRDVESTLAVTKGAENK